MSTIYRVRSLSTVGGGVVEPRNYPGGAGGAFLRLSDAAGAVYDVAANELALSHDDVVAQLKDGRLRPNDLVFLDGTWSTLSDSIPFGDVADAETQSTRRIGAIAGAVFVLLVIGYVLSIMLAK